MTKEQMRIILFGVFMAATIGLGVGLTIGLAHTPTFPLPTMVYVGSVLFGIAAKILGYRIARSFAFTRWWEKEIVSWAILFDFAFWMVVITIIAFAKPVIVIQ